MKPLFCLVLVSVSLILSISLRAQEIPFIEKSILALRKKDNSGDVPLPLKQQYGWYKRDMKNCESQAYYPEFTQNITDLSAAKGIYYPVDVHTPKEGARVKYQTVFERVNKKTPNEFSSVTNNCTGKLPPGYYYVWAERNGKPSTDLQKKVYIYEKLNIDLQE